jgi:hypothetical protein
MPFQRDDALVERLRAVPGNEPVLDAVESTSAHGDLGDVLFRYARSTGEMRVVPLASHDFPGLVATPRGDDRIVAAATGMQWLLLRAGTEPPEGAQLTHEPDARLSSEWWRVHVFDFGVSRAVAEVEIQRWFDAASRLAQLEAP